MSGEPSGSTVSFGSSTQVPPTSGTSLFGSTTRPAQTSPFLWGPQPPQQQPQQQVAHTGTSCDFCGKTNIKGIRYKCLQCLYYDRCESCMAAPRAWAAHDRTHQFFPVHHPDDLTDYNAVKAALPAPHPARRDVHHGIKCDGCQKKDIAGVWYRCLVCDDFDFCDECIGNPLKREAHHVTHPFFPIVSSLFGRARYETMRNAYSAATSAAYSTHPGPSHVGIHCDVCKQEPLVGVRYKCLDCTDFDLCAKCFSNPVQRMTHSLRHVFFPVTTPKDLTQFNHALAMRQAQ